MTIDSSSGVISWTPSTAGDYDVTIEASDGDLFDTQTFTITVLMTDVITLSPPANVEASNNSYNEVLVTWNSVSGATHYQVYRANSLTGTKSAISGWQTGTSYDDTSITPDQVYYYWVKAATSSSGDNASDYSDYDTGWAPAYELDAPYGVEASDIYFDRVEITWNSPSALATHYRVYRADSPTGTRMGISSWQTDTSYNDKSATPGITYYYWVKAATTSSGGNASPYSIYDTGKRLGF
jgi:fibronectin type 3 domain-containing protein